MNVIKNVPFLTFSLLPVSEVKNCWEIDADLPATSSHVESVILISHLNKLSRKPLVGEIQGGHFSLKKTNIKRV